MPEGPSGSSDLLAVTEEIRAHLLLLYRGCDHSSLCLKITRSQTSSLGVRGGSLEGPESIIPQPSRRFSMHFDSLKYKRPQQQSELWVRRGPPQMDDTSAVNVKGERGLGTRLHEKPMGPGLAPGRLPGLSGGTQATGGTVYRPS
uniref:Uncharacterized protein n=1 Tax=Knipowitschia caucasica TaxID=637954 RepID=A0AAV2MG05_KNICA